MASLVLDWLDSASDKATWTATSSSAIGNLGPMRAIDGRLPQYGNPHLATTFVSESTNSHDWLEVQ